MEKAIILCMLYGVLHGAGIVFCITGIIALVRISTYLIRSMRGETERKWE